MRPSSDGSGGKRSESGGPPAGTDHARRPVVVVWELTRACDLACKDCRAEAIPRRHPDELSTAEGRALLEGVRGFGAGQLVVLSGGDPIYRDDAIDLVEHGTDLGLRMTMTPSGTTSLDDGIIAELRDAGLRRLALSLDGGNAEAHDDFRGEAGSFDRTLAAARGADDLGLPLQVNTTVCAETVDDLPAIRDLVADLGAALWSVFFLVPVGRGATLESIQPARAEAVMRWLDEVREAASFGVKTTEAPHFRRVAMQRREIDPGATADEAPRRNGVTAGCGFMFVSHTGEVYPSGFLPVTTGSVLQSDPVRIYRESTLFRSLRDCDALRGKCGVCAYRHVCGGSRSRAYAATGDPPRERSAVPVPPGRVRRSDAGDLRKMTAETTDQSASDPDAVARALERHVTAIVTAAVTTARRRLADLESHDPETAAIVEELASAIADALTAGARETLEADANPQSVAAIAWLFDLDGRGM